MIGMFFNKTPQIRPKLPLQEYKLNLLGSGLLFPSLENTTSLISSKNIEAVKDSIASLEAPGEGHPH